MTKQIIYPLFKFLSRDWAIELVKNGAFKLSKINDFRDGTQYSNHIHDALEGIFHIKNKYDFYAGLFKDANGLLTNMGRPYDFVEVKNLELEYQFNFFQPLIYCTTNHFFSDSLIQAINDKKESCVLITHPELFFDRISKSISDFTPILFGSCIYEGKELIEINPNKDCTTNKLLKNPISSVLYKPESYKNQREVRAVWVRNNEKMVESIIDKIPDLTKYCIQINYDKVDKNKVKEKAKGMKVGVIINYKNGEDARFEYEIPAQICTPIIETDNNIDYLSFIITDNFNRLMKNGIIINCRIVHSQGSIKLIPFRGLNAIKSIQYYTN